MDCSKFRMAIAKQNITYRALAKELGISEQAFYNKASGKCEFKNSEIEKLANLLYLTLNDVNDIFFGGSVN